MSLLHHHDAAGEAKRREAAFERWRAEVLREAGNPSSLARAKARVLAARELNSDPQLLAMVRNFIAERENYFSKSRAAPPLPTLRSSTGHKTRIDERIEPPPPRRDPCDEARIRLKVLEPQFLDNVAHFDEVRAKSTLDALMNLRESFPDLLDESKVGRYTAALKRLMDRCRSFEAHVQRVADHAVASARQGDLDAVDRFLKRLAVVHAAYPHVLPPRRFDEFRSRIDRASRRYEDRRAAQQLLARERAVAAEIKWIASAVHQFHRAARTLPHDAEEYARAEAAYHRAVTAIQSHESDWLAELILELVGLIQEMHGPPGRAQAQIDRFVESVRRALGHLRREIGQADRH